MRRSFSLLMILILITLSASMIPARSIHAQGGYTPEIAWTDCPFAIPSSEVDQVTMECGYLIVPQQRSDPGGAQVELAFAILYATGATSAPDPMVYLEGGPGGSGLSGVDAWYDSPFRQQRDIIVLDQRGTGYSYPFLGCFELGELEIADDASDDEVQAAESAALRECADRLRVENDVDLTAYTSAHNAADVADLRVALGVDQWNLFGISYGTRLALTVMRDYPQGVRSVILDSTYPPVVDAYEEEAVNTQRVFEVLFTDCAADLSCNAAYPNLQQRFFALVDRLNASPATIEDLDESVSGDDLVNAIFQWFYATDVVPYLPMMIHEMDQGQDDTYVMLSDGVLPGQVVSDDEDAVFLFVDEVYWLIEEESEDIYGAFFDQAYFLLVEDGDWDGFVTLVYDTFSEEDAEYLVFVLDAMNEDDRYRLPFELFYEDRSDADGMFNAVECNEEVPFNDYSEAVMLSASVPPQLSAVNLASFEGLRATCAVWNSGTADPIEDLAVSSAIPTFIAAGQYDPITPPDWGRAARNTLSASFFYEFPAVGHGAIDGGPCPVSMMGAFLDVPTVAPDASCINSMSAPVFAVR